MAEKEAKARIKINKLLEQSGWRLFDDERRKANVLLEQNVKVTIEKLNEFGENFENTANGYVDFLLLDEAGYPLVVLEAKAEDKNPLFGKEQARKYALSLNCRFVILSNGNIHYFWDLERGNPHIISRFPSPGTIEGYKKFKPDKNRLINETVDKDYIVLTQKPDYQKDPSYINEQTRKDFIERNKLRFLRDYQVQAVKSIKQAAKITLQDFAYKRIL